MKNIHVVFDLDGTLADTQKIHEKIESDFLVSKWVFIEPHMIGKTYAGRSPIEWIPERLEHEGVHFSYDEIDAFVSSKDSLVVELLEKWEIQLIPWVTETLGLLRDRGYMMAIASGACREFIDKFIEKFWLSMIEASTSADEVTHKKPAPDVFLSSFLKLEEKYGKPTEKWVIGDGKTDVIGWRAAWAHTILCYHSYDIPYEFRVDNFGEITTII
jgi:beta-phosphoglucomutase-like phosphatase (HAD superfamily)